MPPKIHINVFVYLIGVYTGVLKVHKRLSQLKKFLYEHKLVYFLYAFI